ncbi:MAG TPA: metalloregulator ArsR/SmtB family transcription factor [Actinomycetota bacterium]|nr:metalloregulator ArsR/SmtB family transcription factor [Actinomycetota bacterium]
MPLNDAFAALSDPTRREIVARLVDGPQRATDLSRCFPVSRPAVARHLRVLREAGIAEAVPKGRERIYRLTPHAFDEVKRWIDHHSRMWDEALDSFVRKVEDQ